MLLSSVHVCHIICQIIQMLQQVLTPQTQLCDSNQLRQGLKIKMGYTFICLQFKAGSSHTLSLDSIHKKFKCTQIPNKSVVHSCFFCIMLLKCFFFPCMKLDIFNLAHMPLGTITCPVSLWRIWEFQRQPFPVSQKSAINKPQ